MNCVWVMNENKQIKNLLFGFREVEKSVLYVNENITNTLVKDFKNLQCKLSCSSYHLQKVKDEKNEAYKKFPKKSKSILLRFTDHNKASKNIQIDAQRCTVLMFLFSWCMHILQILDFVFQSVVNPKHFLLIANLFASKIYTYQ